MLFEQTLERLRWLKLFMRMAASVSILFLISSTAFASTLDLTGYVMTFNEDFKKLDISSSGPAKPWIAHTPWNGDFGDAAFDNPGPNGPFSLSQNGLLITAHKDSGGKWHSGLIASVDQDGPGNHGFSQRYGYFEMKAKLPTGPGTWPAFWLIGTDKSKSSSEIDVIEYYGAFDNYFHTTEHVWVNGDDQLSREYKSEIPHGILSRQFNTFGVLIEPDQTSFYFNRQQFWTTPTPPEYRQPMYLLANLALGGGWPIDQLTSPQIMEIQYIRAYQKAPTASKQHANNGS